MLSILFATVGDDDVDTYTTCTNTSAATTTTSMNDTTSTTSNSPNTSTSNKHSTSASSNANSTKDTSHSSTSNSVTSAVGGWSIFITGHSLGGALATLMAFELGRINAGLCVCVYVIMDVLYCWNRV